MPPEGRSMQNTWPNMPPEGRSMLTLFPSLGGLGPAPEGRGVLTA